MQQMDPMEDYKASQATKSSKKTEAEADPKQFMFFHHNGVKLDFSTINEPSSRLLATDWTNITTSEEGTPRRLWGDPNWIMEHTGGRDTEKDMWRGVMEIWCSIKRGKKYRDVCKKMREVWEVVYV